MLMLVLNCNKFCGCLSSGFGGLCVFTLLDCRKMLPIMCRHVSTLQTSPKDPCARSWWVSLQGIEGTVSMFKACCAQKPHHKNHDAHPLLSANMHADLVEAKPVTVAFSNTAHPGAATPLNGTCRGAFLEHTSSCSSFCSSIGLQKTQTSPSDKSQC